MLHLQTRHNIQMCLLVNPFYKSQHFSLHENPLPLILPSFGPSLGLLDGNEIFNWKMAIFRGIFFSLSFFFVEYFQKMLYFLVFSRSSRNFGEDPRSHRIYSLGNRGVKKGPGPRGTRDEEFLVPSLVWSHQSTTKKIQAKFISKMQKGLNLFNCALVNTTHNVRRLLPVCDIIQLADTE